MEICSSVIVYEYWISWNSDVAYTRVTKKGSLIEY